MPDSTTLTNGLKVPTVDPVGAAGLDLKNNFIALDPVISKANNASRITAGNNRLGSLTCDPFGIYHNTKFIPGSKPCVTPTYVEGNDQCLHPSVVYIPGGWNGFKYWMAMTPLPWGGSAFDATCENPSILCSNDGDTWQVPAGLTNPIETPPAGGEYFCNDTQLWFENGTLYCFYGYGRQVGTDVGVRVRSSTDGSTWSEYQYFVGPSATYVGNPNGCTIIEKVGDTYYHWALQLDEEGLGTLWVRTSTSLLTGYSAFTQCSFANFVVAGEANERTTYWHGDIKWLGDRFVILAQFSNKGYGYQLYAGVSLDGVTFDMDKYSYTTGLHDGVTGSSWETAYGSGGAYRPCLIHDTNNLRHFFVWYSTLGPARHAPAIGRGDLYFTPNPDYSFDRLDQSLGLMGDARGFWPFFERSGTVITDYSVKANTLTATADIGSWRTPPLARHPSHLLSFDGVSGCLYRADDADFAFGDDSTDLPFSVGCWVYKPSQTTLFTAAGTWLAGETATITVDGIATVATAPADPTPTSVAAACVVAYNTAALSNATLAKYVAYTAPGAGTFVLVTKQPIADNLVMTAVTNSVGGTFVQATYSSYELMNKGTFGSSAAREWRFNLESGGPTFRIYDQSANRYIGRSHNVAIPTSKWNFIVATYDGSKASAGVKIYLNGVRVDNTEGGLATYTALENLAGGLVIGGSEATGPVYTPLLMAKLALPFVSGTELSAVNVTQLYRIQQGIIGTVAK